MYQIQNLTADPIQQQNLVLPDGTIVGMTINYSPRQYCWYISELTYGSFTLQGLQITNSPNMLRQWQNIITFGLACFSAQDREPSQQQDFFTNEAQLYILEMSEVLEYEEYLSSGGTVT